MWSTIKVALDIRIVIHAQKYSRHRNVCVNSLNASVTMERGPNMESTLKKTIFAVISATLIAGGCAQPVQTMTAQDAFMANIAQHCGKAYEGRIVANQPKSATPDPFEIVESGALLGLDLAYRSFS